MNFVSRILLINICVVVLMDFISCSYKKESNEEKIKTFLFKIKNDTNGRYKILDTANFFIRGPAYIINFQSDTFNYVIVDFVENQPSLLKIKNRNQIIDNVGQNNLMSREKEFLNAFYKIIENSQSLDIIELQHRKASTDYFLAGGKIQIMKIPIRFDEFDKWMERSHVKQINDNWYYRIYDRPYYE